MRMAAFVDHYAVLGVNSKADSATIRKAYRQLALQYHPDKAVPGKEVDAANFINAQAAYEILVDGTKRKDYDIQYNRHYKDAHALKSAKQASRVAQVFQPETDGSYGAGYGPDEIVGDEEDGRRTTLLTPRQTLALIARTQASTRTAMQTPTTSPTVLPTT